MSELVQVIIAISGTGGILYVLVKEWIAWRRRKNEHELEEETFNFQMTRKGATFIQDFGIEKIKELEESHDKLLDQLSEIRKELSTIKLTYDVAVKRIDELETANKELKTALDSERRKSSMLEHRLNKFIEKFGNLESE